MTLIKRILLPIGVIIILMVCAVQAITPSQLLANAEGIPSPTPVSNRKTTIKAAFTMYEWWLLNWSNNMAVCQIYVEHEGIPQPTEVYYFCGQALLDQWRATPPCNLGGNISSTSQCSGLYMNLAHITPGQREIEVQLASPSVWVSISGCSAKEPYNRCDKLPLLVLTGEEPLPSESIVSIQGTLDGTPFTCPGGACSLPLSATGPKGVQVEFWSNSSYGDASQHYMAQVRVVPWGDFMSPEGSSTDKPLWYVDVISSQWRGTPQASCSQIWSAFPEVGGPAPWLQTPEQVDGLHSYTSFYFLAGELIHNGEVDVSGCSDGGMQSSVMASECGLEKAKPQLVAWQNQFDSEIIQVTKDTGVPAQLIKNVFGRESQFWPGVYTTNHEAGLGQLTEGGADTLLLWNSSFYSQFCPLVFDTKVCQSGFGNLTDAQQATLRGALVRKVNAACPDCPTGIDLTQANFSVGIFARSLLASCEQVGQIIYDTTQELAGEVSSYTDLWRFTLVNYNAGPGCLSHAMQGAFDDQQPLDWATISSYLEPVCQGAIKYVDDISSMPDLPMLTATPAIPPGVTPTPGGPIETGTALPTITPGGPLPTATFIPTFTPIGPTPTAHYTVTPTPTHGATSTPNPYPPVPTNTPNGTVVPSPTPQPYP